MLEPTLYTFGGILITIGLFWAMRSNRREKSIKTNENPGCLTWLFAFLVLGFGGFVALAIPLFLSWGLYEDARDYNVLHDRGYRQTVPLLDVEKRQGSRNTSYTATYQFEGEQREEYITSGQYKRLRDAETVDILIYGDTIMIADSKPEYIGLLIIIPIGAFGAMMMYGFLWLLMDGVKRAVT